MLATNNATRKERCPQRTRLANNAAAFINKKTKAERQSFKK